MTDTQGYQIIRISGNYEKYLSLVPARPDKLYTFYLLLSTRYLDRNLPSKLLVL